MLTLGSIILGSIVFILDKGQNLEIINIAVPIILISIIIMLAYIITISESGLKHDLLKYLKIKFHTSYSLYAIYIVQENAILVSPQLQKFLNLKQVKFQKDTFLTKIGSKRKNLFKDLLKTPKNGDFYSWNFLKKSEDNIFFCNINNLHNSNHHKLTIIDITDNINNPNVTSLNFIQIPVWIEDNQRNVLYSNQYFSNRDNIKASASISINNKHKIYFDSSSISHLVSSDMHHALIENIDYAYIRLDKNLKTIDYNSNFTKLFGISCELLDNNASYVQILETLKYAQLIPDSNEFKENHLEAIYNNNQSAEIFLLNGKIINFKTIAYMDDQRIVLFNDVTKNIENKRIKQRYDGIIESILEGSPRQIVIFGINGLIRYANSNFKKHHKTLSKNKHILNMFKDSDTEYYKDIQELVAGSLSDNQTNINNSFTVGNITTSILHLDDEHIALVIEENNKK